MVRSRNLLRVAVAAVAMLGASIASAQACRTVATSNAIAVVVCPASADSSALRQAGITACDGKTPCNAWIWDDAAKAPTSAPLKDSDLPKEQAGSARAIWVADANELIVVRRAR